MLFPWPKRFYFNRLNRFTLHLWWEIALTCKCSLCTNKILNLKSSKETLLHLHEEYCMHLWLSESNSTIKITASMIFIFFVGDSNGNKRLQNEWVQTLRQKSNTNPEIYFFSAPSVPLWCKIIESQNNGISRVGRYQEGSLSPSAGPAQEHPLEKNHGLISFLYCGP